MIFVGSIHNPALLILTLTLTLTLNLTLTLTLTLSLSLTLIYGMRVCHITNIQGQ